MGGASYDALRQRERLILISAIESIQITRLGSDNFTWAQDITEAMTTEAAADAATAAADEAALGDLLIEQEDVFQVEND